MNIAEQYANGNLNGWAGPELAKREFEILYNQGAFRDFKIERPAPEPRPRTGKKMFLYEVVRKALGKDTENYRQEIGDPFVAGTKVLMANGTEKNIEDIVIGEKIINHKGQPANVTNVIKKNFTGNLVTIEVKGWHRKLTATETHLGMYLPYNGKRFKFGKIESIKFSEYAIGDYVLLPFGIQSKNELTLDLAEFLPNRLCDNQVIFGKKRNIYRYIKIDEKFARFIGLYLAEGGLHSNGISFSFNSNEQLYIQEIIAYAKDIFGIDATIQKTGYFSCARVSLNSHLVKEFFAKFIPGKLYTKQIPNSFYHCKQAVKLALLRGWLDGDGFKNFPVNACIGYTSSDNLGNDIVRLAISCGLNPRSWKRMRKTRSSVPNTEIAFYGEETYKIYDNNNLKTQKTKTITCNNTPYGYARPIKNITKEYVVDKEVYCITTENEFAAIFNGIAQFQCVSFGMKNAIEYLQCCEILLKGDAEKFQNIFPPYIYGISRNQIGGSRISGDGSLGSWAADGVKKYGILSSIDEGVPQYSGNVAKQWGGRSGVPSQFIPIGQKHLVKSAARITSVDALADAICNGYPCTVASNQGFNETPDSKGFHRAQGNWGHQMCLIGIDLEHSEPYVLILNSWGDVHGKLKSFYNDDTLPAGVLRARINEIERTMIAGGDSEVFATSQYDGYPEQRLDKALFRVL